jgi:hypothetical protein
MRKKPIDSFIVKNISAPPEVEQAIDKRSSMAAVGNLTAVVENIGEIIR